MTKLMLSILAEIAAVFLSLILWKLLCDLVRGNTSLLFQAKLTASEADLKT